MMHREYYQPEEGLPPFSVRTPFLWSKDNVLLSSDSASPAGKNQYSYDK